jgi:hypothetical protein
LLVTQRRRKLCDWSNRVRRWRIGISLLAITGYSEFPTLTDLWDSTKKSNVVIASGYYWIFRIPHTYSTDYKK